VIFDLSSARDTLERQCGEIHIWDTSFATDMSSALSGESIFNEDIFGCDTSSVTNMSHIFQSANAFNQDISGWDTSGVTDMSGAFRNADAFDQNIRKWDTSRVMDMSFMFESAVTFNQDISSWDTSSVTNMSRMFAGARDFNQDIYGWDVENVQDFDGMFASPSAFKQNLCTWADDPKSGNERLSASEPCPSPSSILLIAGGGFVALVALSALLLLRRRMIREASFSVNSCKKKNFSGFLSRYRQGGATATLLKVRMEKKLNGDVVHLDDLATLLDKVLESKALINILTKSYLRRPYCLAELVVAHRAGMHIVTVHIQGIDREFWTFKDLSALDQDKMQLFMDDVGWRIFEDHKISRQEAWAAIQRIKEINATQVSPASSSAV